MSKPAKIKLTIYQGATYRRRLRWSDAARQPIDLTGCTARMQVREDVESPTVLLSLTTENGRTVRGGAVGTIDLTIAAFDTAAIKWTAGAWDLEIVHPGGDVTRLAQGSVAVSPEVTRG